ncbi:MAG TPA: 30S ribosomal protein S16 [Candidatus Deferrimicrobium sp.]|nr:30S ribosomal protein S16 [Candidatus Deferrimicrobium sp.]
MPVHIRLRRMGSKKRPFFRIVAADSRRARDGRFLEVLGTYSPIVRPAEVSVFEDRMTRWLDEGAVPSDTVRTLLNQIGFAQKYRQGKKGENISAVSLKTTIRERPKKTRKMKKAAVAGKENEPAGATKAADKPE